MTKQRPIIVYCHGFNSSPESEKACQLHEKMQAMGLGDCIEIPFLNHDPLASIAHLESLIESHLSRGVRLVGSSLGGYYCLYLAEKYQLKAALINPAITPYILIQDYMGDNINVYTQVCYTVTPKHIDELRMLEVSLLTDQTKYLLLCQTADDVCDYREALEKLPQAKHIIQAGGSHDFDHFETVIDDILHFFDFEVATAQEGFLSAN